MPSSDDIQNLEKTYDPAAHEDAIAAKWSESGEFNPDTQSNIKESAEPFSIVLPPPNVTGTLHMGHAAMLAIEDTMVRFARMQGRPTLWVPGTDHAAIATESKVEKLMIERGEIKSRHDLGREEFLKHVDAFAQDSHDTIVGQVRKMGASVDWSREAYTMDSERKAAVNEAFKRMFNDGLIYKGQRVINWDPKGQTTVSDDEVVHKEVKAKLYTFKYGPECPITIATTRPETKVGDTAIAVHPTGRWKDYIGETFEVADFCGAKLTLRVIGDDYVDEAFGTGALGVTPAHSAADDELAKRHDLESITVIGRDGRMMENAGNVAGMTATEAREAVAEWLEKAGLLEEVEEIDQQLSTAERSGGVIEPLPMEQWFIDVNKEFERDGNMVTLKSLMQAAVREKEIEILPERFEKTYFHWIDNLRDWNISRQIWFGHRVPVWRKGEEMVVGDAPEGEGWEQESDTLDTWFSAGLWTFSTLGWPNSEAADYKKFHPTSVLETGYDILFFWVARMILMSTYLVGEIPFKQVYLHGLVRDEQGRKMSKSLGNIINPLDMIKEFGADATRLSLMIGATPGNDMKLSEEKIAGFRNFTNKLWNISRFVFMSVDEVRQIKEMPEPVTAADGWILHRLSEVTKKATEHYEKHEFSAVGELLREFTWSEFADWYVEVAKTQMSPRTQEILLYVLEAILKLWHPFMPFVTEVLYEQFNSEGLLAVAEWPSLDYMNTDAVQAFERLQAVATFARNIRAQYNVAYSNPIIVELESELLDDAAVAAIQSLTKAESVNQTGGFSEGQSASAVVSGVKLQIPLEGLVDFEAEKNRLQKELAKLEGYVKSLEGQLANKGFLANAGAEVVEARKASLKEAQQNYETLKQEYESL